MTGDERPADQRPADQRPAEELGGNIDPDAALRRIDEVDRRARRETRWVAWLWIGLGFVTSTFAIGSEIWKTGVAGEVISWIVPAGALVALVYGLSRRADSRVGTQIEGRVTAAFFVAVIILVVAKMTVLPDGPSVALVLLGLLPAVPCAYAAWRIFAA